MNDQLWIQTTRRRGTMLKLVREGHEEQLSRMDDFEMFAMMQDIGVTMSRNQVMTMLQDLAALGLVKFRTEWSEGGERYVGKDIELTAAGTALVVRRRNTDEVRFD